MWAANLILVFTKSNAYENRDTHLPEKGKKVRDTQIWGSKYHPLVTRVSTCIQTIVVEDIIFLQNLI